MQSYIQNDSLFWILFLKSGIDIAEVICRKFKRTANRHPIYRYLESGEFDTEYFTTALAAKNTPNTHASSIKKAVVNGDLYKGYRWSYFKASNYYDIENPKEYTEVPAIEQYDKEGNLIKIWKDYKECKKEFPYCLDVCRNKIKSTAGFIFKYKD